MFDLKWSLRQLIEVVRLTGRIELGHLVAARLAVAAQSEPRLAVEALQLLIRGDKQGWGITAWRDQLTTLLTTVSASQDSDARRIGIDVVHELGARGYREFRSLLSHEVSPGDSST